MMLYVVFLFLYLYLKKIKLSACSGFSSTLDINQLDLSQLNYMLSDYIQDATGNLNGRIIVKDDFKTPVFNGTLNFKDAGTEFKFLKTYYSLGNEIVTIENNIIDFNSLSIVNKLNQSAKIIGKVTFDSDKMPYSDLHVVTENMKIFNSTRRENDMVYGILKALSDIKIIGYTDQLKVDANVEIDRTSDITYIFPENLAINDSKGVVTYGIFEGDSVHDKQISETSTFFSLNSFEDVRSQIKVNPGSKVNLFFDQDSKDFLEASINGRVNHRLYKGNTEISGRLEIDEGRLRYSIPLVTAKDYKIEPGSYFTISNDIYNPYLNIVASSRVRASTEGLLDGHNKVLNFKVLLYINGSLNDLKLTFDISPETNDAIITARLALLTEQERNINALNLLARGAFVISVNGTNAGSSSVLDAQIDRFIATQLNAIISENIQFVDLHFDAQSYMNYSSSDRQVFQRDYYYNVGKSFLRERARVNYTGSMELTSKMYTEQLHSSFVQNEFDVEVKIDKEGTFRGVFFRKNKYEGVLEGEVVKTGGGIRIIKNFESIKDIFTRGKKAEKATDKKEQDNE
jgi:translocation and assembly module TamB